MIKKVTFFLISAFFIFFIASRIYFFTPTFLETLSSYITYPALQIAHFIAKPIEKNFFAKRRTIKELEKQCTTLKNENQNLLQENIKLNALFHFDEKSKDLRLFQNRYELENAILAKVLVKTFTNEEHSIIVNRGSRDGIEKDMVAIFKFQLVGRVTHVTPCYSKILLITDNQSKVSVYTNTSSARGIAVGTNQVNKCHLRYISHLNTIHDGDFILSSGQGLVFPEGFCIGKIINVKKQDICYDVEVKPLIDLDTLEMCLLTNQEKMNLF